MGEVKVISMYLPQYHRIPENDKFWGEGFTDWVTVRNGEPLFPGHEQPKVPLDDRYYDLSVKESIEWQVKTAKEYGISGFGIYHYWFSSENVLLTKPAEIILQNKDLSIPFFFAWDNVSWKRTWSKVKGNDWAPLNDDSSAVEGPSILVEYKFGGIEEWEKHFYYLLPYFKDERYIRTEDKPVFVIFHYSPDQEKMCKYWDELAKQEGIKGIEFIYRYDQTEGIPKHHRTFRYEPAYSGWGGLINRAVNRIQNLAGMSSLKIYQYDEIWKKILKNATQHEERKIIPGAFVAYDDTPRRGAKGRVVKGETPEKFQKYMEKLISICKSKDEEFIFLTAWNEWGEGAYLEPDQKRQYAFLEMLRNAVNKSNEI